MLFREEAVPVRQPKRIDRRVKTSLAHSAPPCASGIAPQSPAGMSPDAFDVLLRRVRAEFLEMPGLCLTMAQARRLWCLEPSVCDAVFRALIESRFLSRTENGLFVLRANRV